MGKVWKPERIVSTSIAVVSAEVTTNTIATLRGLPQEFAYASLVFFPNGRHLILLVYSVVATFLVLQSRNKFEKYIWHTLIAKVVLSSWRWSSTLRLQGGDKLNRFWSCEYASQSRYWFRLRNVFVCLIFIQKIFLDLDLYICDLLLRKDRNADHKRIVSTLPLFPPDLNSAAPSAMQSNGTFGNDGQISHPARQNPWTLE